MALPKYGTYLRATKRLNVLRGYPGNESTSFTRSLSPEPAGGTGYTVAILSGMIISINANGKWVAGCPQGSVPYIAYHDATDTDVASSGLLLGLSCLGDFEVETTHFDSTQAYNPDAPLKAATSSDCGKVKLCEAPGGNTVWDDTNDIVGVVTRGKQQVGGTAGPGTYQALTPTTDSSFGTMPTPPFSAATALCTLIWATRFTPRAHRGA
jgi:hypothetical protein